MIDFARGRAWFAGEVYRGQAGEILAAVAAGADIETLLLGSPIGPLLIDAGQVLERALGIFERLGDRTGVMSTVIAMAYAQLRAGHAPVLLGAAPRGDPAGDQPPVRRRHRERAGPPRPPDAVRGPRLLAGKGRAGPGAVPRRGRPPGGQAPGRPGDRVPRRGRRRDVPARARRRRRAPRSGSVTPPPRRLSRQTRSRTIQLETWRGRVRAGAGDAEGMRDHLEQAVTLATEGGRAAARCEALARLAIEAARLLLDRAAAPTRPSSSSSSDRRCR